LRDRFWVRKWLVGRGTGRLDVAVPWEPVQECVEGLDCGYQANRSHRRTALDEESVQVSREECGLALGKASRGRRWVMTEQCCWENWDENASRVDERSGRPRPRVSAILTLRIDQCPASEFDYCGCCASSMGGDASCRGVGDVWLECFHALLE